MTVICRTTSPVTSTTFPPVTAKMAYSHDGWVTKHHTIYTIQVYTIYMERNVYATSSTDNKVMQLTWGPKTPRARKHVLILCPQVSGLCSILYLGSFCIISTDLSHTPSVNLGYAWMVHHTLRRIGYVRVCMLYIYSYSVYRSRQFFAKDSEFSFHVLPRLVKHSTVDFWRSEISERLIPSWWCVLLLET
jgi:hypothetical protein